MCMSLCLYSAGTVFSCDSIWSLLHHWLARSAHCTWYFWRRIKKKKRKTYILAILQKVTEVRISMNYAHENRNVHQRQSCLRFLELIHSNEVIYRWFVKNCQKLLLHICIRSFTQKIALYTKSYKIQKFGAVYFETISDLIAFSISFVTQFWASRDLHLRYHV